MILLPSDVTSRVCTSLSLAWNIFLQEGNRPTSQPPEANWRSTDLWMDRFQEMNDKYIETQMDSDFEMQNL